MRTIGLLMTVTVAIVGVTCMRSARAQTIQLPTMSQFSVDTSVVVPDRGGVSIAGQRSAAAGSARFNGLPPSRAIGASATASGVSVTAQIHDPAEAEAALTKRVAERHAPADNKPQARSNVVLHDGDAGLRSVAEIRAARAQAAAALASQTREIVTKARKAQTAGKLALATQYYRAASRQATGKLKQQVDAELRQLDAQAARAKIAAPAKP